MADPAVAAERYHFDDFTLDLGRACLLKGDVPITLRPKSFDLLCYLARHPGRLLGKDELLAALWPGLVVTDDSLTRCVSEVRAALGDEAQRLIKTVPRRGYLFEASVRPADAAASPWRRRPGVVAAWLVAVALAVGLGVAGWRVAQRGEAPRLSIIVLPFETLGADPSQSYLADVVGDELTNALARLRGVTVIASGTALRYRGAAIDLPRLGDELKVRYVVLGSVQRSGERLRVGARLADAATARTLWSDEFDVERGDLGALPDNIVARLANALDAELILADSARTRHLAGDQLEAEDLAMQCEAAAARQQGESGEPSYELCERALQKDPDNVRALVRLALYHGDRVERVQSPDRARDLALARGWVDRALALDVRDYGAHCANAIVLAGEHRVRDALAAAERCRSLNPSHARAYRLLATFHFFLGEPEKTLEYVDAGMRLSPRDFQIAAFQLFKGWALFMEGRDEEALEWLRKAEASSPESPSILPPLASVLALTGRDAEARATMARYLALPRTHTKTLARWDHTPDDNEVFRRFAERFKGGLRRAGMPER